MKGSLVTSAVLHILLLGWMMLSLGSPEPFEVAAVESLPVDIVPIEELTQIQQGDKKATAKEKAAPVPTKRQDAVKDAENSGENDVDLKSPPTPEKKPEKLETAAAPEKVEKVQPKVDPVPNDTKEIVKEEVKVEPATEVAEKAEPKVEVKPEPKPEVKQETKPEPKPEPAKEEPAETPDDAEALPDNVPVPVSKPKPAVEKKTEDKKPDEKKPDAKPTETAEAKTAKTPDRKKSDDKQKKETAKSASSKESDFNADEVAALLNKQESSGGGAKRSADQAALGGKKTTGGTKLSQSEMDALRGMIEQNWSIIPGLAESDGVTINVRFNLDQNGEIVGEPVVKVSGATGSSAQVWASGARRAVLKSAPFKNLPADKYDAWGEVSVDFAPQDML